MSLPKGSNDLNSLVQRTALSQTLDYLVSLKKRNFPQGNLQMAVEALKYLMLRVIKEGVKDCTDRISDPFHQYVRSSDETLAEYRMRLAVERAKTESSNTEKNAYD